MSDILINSFQWGLANDKNVWQTGAFWNSKNIEYRKNSSYIELSKWSQTWIVAVPFIPTALQFWESGSSIATDLVAFTINGKIYTTAWLKYTITVWWSIINTATANWKKYLIGTGHLHEFINTTTVTEWVKTFTTSSTTRPVLNFYWDLIIGNWTFVIRYNKDGTLIEWVSWSTSAVIWWLEWTIQSITQVWPNIYLWCNDGTNTIMYIWDWVSSSPTQKVVYTDMPVVNVALLWNQHYWYASKSDQSIRQVLIGDSYSPQTYIKSCFPAYPILTAYDDEKNRMTIVSAGNTYVNAIETTGDIVLFPWIGCIFWFGRYLPWQPYSFSKDYSFTGTYVTAMVSGWITSWSRDAGGFLAYSVFNWSTYDVNLINLWQEWATPSIVYASSGTIETMEYLAPNFSEWENSMKITFPFNLPHSSTSIKVYVKYDRGSYTLIKTINTTEYGTWYDYAEILDTGKWRTKQIKFELITSNTAYTPQLYTQITNKQQEVWKR